jgi:hypothetical protein
MKNKWKKNNRNIQGNLLKQVPFKLDKYLQAYGEAPPRSTLGACPHQGNAVVDARLPSLGTR